MHCSWPELLCLPLQTIVATLKPFNTFSFTIPLEDQILIVLMRLRHDHEEGVLARMFKISQSYVSKVFNSWITIMADKLGKLIAWLPRDVIRATLPASFSDFEDTTCIIDCAETFMQQTIKFKGQGRDIQQLQRSQYCQISCWYFTTWPNDVCIKIIWGAC